MKLSKVIGYTLTIVIILIVCVRLFMPTVLEKDMNKVVKLEEIRVSEEAKDFHSTLIVGDWHADSLLWNRDLAERSDFGHVDIPRLQEGNVALQMFTTVTKSPSGLNYDENQADAADNITRIAMLQGWPIDTWSSLTARAIHQASRLADLAKNDSQNFQLIRSQAELESFIARRNIHPKLVGGLLGTEGSHALDGKIENIQVLYNKGFRMMSLQHFFDNKLGGSLHGTSQKGLTEFGKQAVKEMLSLDIIVDLSHSSTQTVKDVLAMTDAPMVVSHTGFKGHCDRKRNIDDELMINIAANGGLIAVGFWQEAACGTQPSDIADAIIYGIQLLGEDHISLGSDFDGAVTTGIDASQIAAITQALLEKGVKKEQIAKVMGGNMLAFLTRHLPSH